jgi:hypothetical protein
LAPRQLGFLEVTLSNESTQALLAPLSADELEHWQ